MQFFKKLFNARIGFAVIVLGLFFGVGLLFAQSPIPSAPSAPISSPPPSPSVPSLISIPPAPQAFSVAVACDNAIGGEFVDGTCRFSLNTCPFGWTPDQNWSATNVNTCDGDDLPNCRGATSCTTVGSHGWGNIAVETCSFDREFMGAAFNNENEDKSAFASLLAALLDPDSDSGLGPGSGGPGTDPGTDPDSGLEPPVLECTTRQATCFASVTQIGCRKT